MASWSHFLECCSFDDDAVVLVDVDADVVVVADLHDDVGFSLDLIIAGN